MKQFITVTEKERKDKKGKIYAPERKVIVNTSQIRLVYEDEGTCCIYREHMYEKQTIALLYEIKETFEEVQKLLCD